MNVIEFRTASGQVVLVEDAVRVAPSRQKRSGKSDRIVTKARQSLEETVGSMTPFMDAVVSGMRGAVKKPTKITLEIGLKLTAESGVILSLGGEAHYKLTVDWEEK